MTNPPRQSEEGLAGQVKFLGYVLAALVLVLVIHTVYVGQAAPRPDKHNSPDNLEAVRSPRSEFYTLVDKPSEGQVVYVPAYSHIYQGAGDPYLLTITLSVRNTSVDHEIVVEAIRYFDTHGVETRAYLAKPVRLPALGTTEVVVQRDDRAGGSGANFLVEWHAKTPVTAPIIEAVMVATSSQRAVAFARRGVAISEAKPAAREAEGVGASDQPRPDSTPVGK